MPICGSPTLKLADSERLPKDADGPVFAEPWEAQAFAMAVKLNEAGVFDWSEWAETLGAELKAHPLRPYYESWLAALERLVLAKGVLTEQERLARVDAWDRELPAFVRRANLVERSQPGDGVLTELVAARASQMACDAHPEHIADNLLDPGENLNARPARRRDGTECRAIRGSGGRYLTAGEIVHVLTHSHGDVRVEGALTSEGGSERGVLSLGPIPESGHDSS